MSSLYNRAVKHIRENRGLGAFVMPIAGILILTLLVMGLIHHYRGDKAVLWDPSPEQWRAVTDTLESECYPHDFVQANEDLGQLTASRDLFVKCRNYFACVFSWAGDSGGVFCPVIGRYDSNYLWWAVIGGTTQTLDQQSYSTYRQLVEHDSAWTLVSEVPMGDDPGRWEDALNSTDWMLGRYKRKSVWLNGLWLRVSPDGKTIPSATVAR